MTRFNQHNLKFTYRHAVAGQDDGQWTVLANHKVVGRVVKAPGGWYGFIDGKEVTFRTGPRSGAAEALAYHAGLLDGNYNAI
jgi:hypothetical protein